MILFCLFITSDLVHYLENANSQFLKAESTNFVHDYFFIFFYAYLRSRNVFIEIKVDKKVTVYFTKRKPIYSPLTINK